MHQRFLILFLTVLVFSYVATSAVQNVSAYKCPDENAAYGPYTAKDLAKLDYEDRVYSFNKGVESKSASIEELNKAYMQPGSTVDDLNQMANCLYEKHGVDPDSVATFSDKAHDVLSYDMEKLVEVAPDLAKHGFGISSTAEAQEAAAQTSKTQGGGGCLIATAAYGSELAPQVQLLRELRDNTILGTSSGTSFMSAFNSLYYSFSPAIADFERQNPVFKESVKIAITPMLSTLSILSYAEIDSEREMLGYGIGIILLNVGMYFVAPAIIILKLKPRNR